MSSFVFFTRVRTYFVLSLLTALFACGGSESSGDASSRAVASNAAANPSATDSLATNRDNVAEAAAKSVFFAKTGSLPGVPTSKDYHPRRVLAQLINATQVKATSAEASKLSAMGLRQIAGFATGAPAANKSSEKSAANPLAVFEITDSAMTVPQAIEQLKRSGLVVYAEPDYYMQRRLAPNDAQYNLYWHLKNTGQSGGLVGNDINAETAWNTSTGNGSMVVAVIDDGVKFDHPDLAPNMWASSGTPRAVVAGDPSGAAGVADDANGANLAFERAGDTSIMPYNREESDHGTMVSGFIGSSGNNVQGGTGVGWNVKIMGIKIEGPAPNYALSSSSFVNSIRYVIAKKNAGVNVKIINISYGLVFYSQALKDAMEEANAAGILIVVAAGNDGSNDESVVGYLSGYRTPNLISVGALDRTNNRADFSNYGNLVHLFAPGKDVPTTSSRTSLANNSRLIAPYYRYIDGTSFSSPIVAGAAALVWMQYPTETASQIKARLLNSSSQFLTSLDSLTTGKLNLGAAMANVAPCVPTSPALSELANQLVQGGTHKLSVFVKKCPTTGAVDLSITSGSSPAINLVLKDDGVYPDEYASDGYYGGTFVAPASGTQPALTVVVQDSVSGPRSLSTFKSLKSAKSYVQATTMYAWDTPSTVTNWTGATNYDDTALIINSAFPLTFDGRTTSRIYMSTNGYVCMEETNCSSYLTFPIPSGKDSKPLGTSLAMLAPWWNDWTFECASSDMYAELWGTAPNRRLVLTWKDARQSYSGFNCTSTAPGVSFQTVFYEGQSYVDYRYRSVITSVPGGVINPSYGANGSGGVQLSGGKLGTQSFYKSNTALSNFSAIRFTPTSPSFSDVNAADFFSTSVEGLRGAIITVGCNTERTLFCADFGRGTPDAQIKTTQQQMAAFLGRAINGHDLLADYTPYPNSGFTDVFGTFTKYVNFLKVKGIMTGTGPTADKFCNGDCNLDFVTRAQMARYLVKAVRGGSYVPPSATGTVFTDVPASHPEAPFIEEVARMKISLGKGDGTYGPSENLTRGQMATFLQRTFRPFDPH